MKMINEKNVLRKIVGFPVEFRITPQILQERGGGEEVIMEFVAAKCLRCSLNN